ncbi:hypothetical protein YDYSY3_38060 [Paenibacillus chitinolyticus]|nr:hypothetical protein YDYSY3_38060 [Paenibacillus chitinolyticus]
MVIENHVMPTAYEVERARLLKGMTKDELKTSLRHCKQEIQRFASLCTVEMDRYIAYEIMGWIQHSPESAYYITQDGYVRMDLFQPSGARKQLFKCSIIF